MSVRPTHAGSGGLVFHLYDFDVDDCIRYGLVYLMVSAVFWMLEQAVFGVMRTAALAA